MKFFEHLLRKTPPATAEQKSPPTIYDLARKLGDRFDEVAHPAELSLRENAAAVVEHDLLPYTLAENARVASLALCALSVRGDATVVESILEHINEYSAAWTKYFALEALNALVPAPAPLLGRLFVALNDDWSDGYDRFLLEFIREFARRRAAAGEIATFHDALAKAKNDRLEDVAELLEKLDSSIAAPMREELTSFRDGQTNLEMLRGIGRVLENENAPLVHHEQLTSAATLIEESLTGERRRSVLVVGDPGVGKSAVIRAAASRLRDNGWTIFEATATELNAGQSYIGSLEARVQKMIRNLRTPRRIVWIIPNLHELQHTGSHRSNPMGALDMLLPAIDSGSIAVIGEMSSSAYQTLLEEKPRVRSAFVDVRVDPLREDQALSVTRDWVSQCAPDRIAEPVVTETWQLATQYLSNRSAPCCVLDLLTLTLARVETAPILVDDVVTTLSQMTGIPLDLLDERATLDLTALRARFEKRILGQPEAIDVLVERVAMIKAGVTDPTRPLGVFLFAGPTGTGKTEIAKTLAEALFGSAERMLRIDMSEFQTPESLRRIIGDGGGGRSLVDEIRKQPFSVVLLDEMEKAHPRVLDLFLQVFDDGRLTDRRGNTGDFRQAIVILTSNLGAATQTIGLQKASETSNIQKALARELRKEFLNRIDRVVVFRPLSRETMREILRKELIEVFHRRGLRNRDWTIECDDSAIDFLLADGFTEDLGARPLKRAIERHVLTPFAQKIVTKQMPKAGSVMVLRAENGGLTLSV
jgi:ATP-dependent Clp protease ATP-binding subunit ClpC